MPAVDAHPEGAGQQARPDVGVVVGLLVEASPVEPGVAEGVDQVVEQRGSPSVRPRLPPVRRVAEAGEPELGIRGAQPRIEEAEAVGVVPPGEKLLAALARDDARLGAADEPVRQERLRIVHLDVQAHPGRASRPREAAVAGSGRGIEQDRPSAHHLSPLVQGRGVELHAGRHHGHDEQNGHGD